MPEPKSKLSKEYLEQEAKNLKEKEEQAQQEINKNTKCYVAPASKHTIGNWRKEVKTSDGSISVPEASLQFSDNVFITDDPEKQKFIENSKSFKNGIIKLCETPEEAKTFIAQVMAVKSVKTIQNVDKSA